jgi:hypothetical protein
MASQQIGPSEMRAHIPTAQLSMVKIIQGIALGVDVAHLRQL